MICSCDRSIFHMDSVNKDVCRVCLSESENNSSLYTLIRDEITWRKLYACTSVKVNPSDSLSKILCTTCINQINDAYNLRKRAQSSDITLRKNYGIIKIEYVNAEDEDFDTETNDILENHEKIYEISSSHIPIDIKADILNPDKIDNSIDNVDNRLENLNEKTRSKSNVKTNKLKISKKRLKKESIKHKSDNLLKKEIIIDCKLLNDEQTIEADILECTEKFHEPVRLNKKKDSEKCDKTKITYKCMKCACIFNHRNFYDKHMKAVHNLNGHGRTKKYMCDICGNIFHDKYGLAMHMRCHSGDRPFTCNICGQGFSQLINMKRHISAKHHKVKSYQCELCPKRFAYSSTLREHARNHSGELLHSCDVCDRRFSRRFSLVRHQLTHTRARPFTCVHCSKAYTQTNDLKAHVKRAHPGVTMEKLSDYCIKELKK